MSKQRVVKDEIWDDEWFYDLTPEQKLVWLFLLTNPRSNIAGVYKINIKWSSNLLGMSPAGFQTALKFFIKTKKIKIHNEWLILLNFHKHQSKNPKVEAGVARILAGLPKEVLDLLPMDSLCIAYPTLLNLTLLISKGAKAPKSEKTMAWTPRSSDENDEGVVDYDSGELKPLGGDKKPKRTYKEVYTVFEEVLKKKPPLNWMVNVTQQKAAENLMKERGLKAIKNALEFYKENEGQEFLPTITSPSDLDAKWTKLAMFKKKNYGG